MLVNALAVISGTGCPSDLASHFKILTPQQTFQIFPLALGQEKAGNTSENLLNEIRKVIYWANLILYWANENAEKVYNNIMGSIKL